MNPKQQFHNYFQTRIKQISETFSYDTDSKYFKKYITEYEIEKNRILHDPSLWDTNNHFHSQYFYEVIVDFFIFKQLYDDLS